MDQTPRQLLPFGTKKQIKRQDLIITSLTCLTAENLPLMPGLGGKRQPLFLPETRDLLSLTTLHDAMKRKQDFHSNHLAAIRTWGKLWETFVGGGYNDSPQTWLRFPRAHPRSVLLRRVSNNFKGISTKEKTPPNNLACFFKNAYFSMTGDAI